MVAEHTSDAAEVVVGIETDSGLWVAAPSLGAPATRCSYAINPSCGFPYRLRRADRSGRIRNTW